MSAGIGGFGEKPFYHEEDDVNRKKPRPEEEDDHFAEQKGHKKIKPKTYHEPKDHAVEMAAEKAMSPKKNLKRSEYEDEREESSSPLKRVALSSSEESAKIEEAASLLFGIQGESFHFGDSLESIPFEEFIMQDEENNEVVEEALELIPEEQREEARAHIITLFSDLENEHDQNEIMQVVQGVAENQRAPLLKRMVPYCTDGIDGKKRAEIFMALASNDSSARGKTLLNLFNNGYAEAVKRFLKEEKKLATQSSQKVERSQVSLHNEKTVQTTIAQKILSDLLKDFSMYRINHEDDKYYLTNKEGSYLQYSTGEKVELQEFIKKVDFNQIQFSAEEVSAYQQLLHIYDYVGCKPEIPDAGFPTVGACSELLEGEKEAINIYTGDDNTSMIRFMQGRISDVCGESDRLKSLFISSAMCVAALNKLPDFHPTQKFLFRYDASLKPEKMNERIKAVKEGKGITRELGFISTSHTQPSYEYVIQGTVATLFYNCKAKYIAPLSEFPEEREVLLPPTEIQWKYHYAFNDDGIEKHIFIAKPVMLSK